MEWVRLGLLTLVLAALQGSLIAVIPWPWARPDLLLALLVVTAMQRGPGLGTWFGFILGIIQDLNDPGLLGLRALSMALIGFSAGRFAENVDRNSRFVQGLVMLGLGVLGRVLDTVLVAVVERTSTWWSFLTLDLPVVAVTALVIPIALWVLGLAFGQRRV